MSDREPMGYKAAKKKAEKIALDTEKMGRTAEDAFKKAEKHKTILRSVWDDLLTMIRVIRAFAKAEYKQIAWQSLIAILAAVFYFVNPFDVIPDFIPVFGYLDDATIIGFAARFIHDDLEAFRNWERTK